MSDQRALAYSLQGAADLLGLGRETVRRLCLDGTLRHRKVGKRFCIPHAALEEFLSGATFSSESTAAPLGAADEPRGHVAPTAASDVHGGGANTPPPSPHLTGVAASVGQ